MLHCHVLLMVGFSYSHEKGESVVGLSMQIIPVPFPLLLLLLFMALVACEAYPDDEPELLEPTATRTVFPFLVDGGGTTTALLLLNRRTLRWW